MRGLSRPQPLLHPEGEPWVGLDSRSGDVFEPAKPRGLRCSGDCPDPVPVAPLDPEPRPVYVSLEVRVREHPREGVGSGGYEAWRAAGERGTRWSQNGKGMLPLPSPLLGRSL